MKVLHYIGGILLMAGFSLQVHAQDPHFSQYYASPLTLNPANTGFFDGDARIAVNERQQWWNVGYNYNTTSVSSDVKLFKERIPEFDTFAAGISGIFEKSLNGALQSNYLSLSSAYHKSLGYEGSHRVGLGIQLNYTNKYFDYTKLSFASQYNGKFFDPTVPVSFDYSDLQAKYFDINAGILYAFHSERANLYAGASLYHINQPNETLFNAAGSTLPMRKTVHAGGEVILAESSSVLFSGYYSKQGYADDSMYGGAYCLKTVSRDNVALNLYLGMWYRSNYTVTPYIGADLQNFSLGVNYGVSSGSDIAFSPNTFEVSLIYRFKANTILSSLCPRF
ncbi:PorP/SprF family type IX secretion system membrane protein [Mucilaginibacter sp. AW1-3]